MSPFNCPFTKQKTQSMSTLKDLQVLVADSYSSDEYESDDEDGSQHFIIDDAQDYNANDKLDVEVMNLEDFTASNKQNLDNLSVDQLKKLLDYIDNDDVPVFDETVKNEDEEEVEQQEITLNIDDEGETSDSEYEAKVSDFVSLYSDNHAQRRVKQDKRQLYKELKDTLSNSMFDMTKSEPSSLQFSDLVSIHNEISGRVFQERVGVCSAVKVSDDLIAVGTSYGLILLYDRLTERRVAILGSVVGAQSNSPVTTLSFAGKISRFLQSEKKSKRRILVAGYSDGKVAYWNTDNYLPLKVADSTVTTLSQPVFKIVSLQHGLDEIGMQSCIVVDGSGQMRQITLRKVMFSYSVDVVPITVQSPYSSIGNLSSDSDEGYSFTRTLRNNIFGSGKQNDRAFVADMDLLVKGEAPIPLNAFALLAIATRNEVIIKTLKPEIKNVTVLKSSGDNQRPPAIAWLKNTLPDGVYDPKEVVPTGTSPKLAVCWGNQLKIYQVSNQSNDISLVPLHDSEVTTPFPVGNLYWFSKDVIAIISSDQNQFAIVVPSQNSVVDQIDITCIDTMYIDCAHALGGVAQLGDNNKVIVKEQLDPTTNGSSGAALMFPFKVAISHTSASMFFLGHSGLLSLRCQSWSEGITNLCKSGRYQHGLELASKVYLGAPLSMPLIGLPLDEAKRKSAAAEIISSNLIAYATTVIQNELSLDKEQNYWDVGKSCLRYCIDIQNFEIINNLYSMYIKEGKKSVFIDLIVRECIVKGRLNSLDYYTSGNSNPLFDDIVEQYSKSEDKLDILETVILNLVLSKKFYSFETFSKLYNPSKPAKMLRAYIYAQNALKDQYIEPLRDIMPLIDNVEVGLTIIDYLRVCATGRSLSSSYVIEDQMISKLKKQILDFIFAGTPSTEKSSDKVLYRNLTALMKHHPERLFEILNIFFFDDSPSSPFQQEDLDFTEDSLLDGLNTKSLAKKVGNKAKYTRQEMADKLLGVVCPPTEQSSAWTNIQLSIFFVFEAGLIHAGYIKLPPKHMKRIVSHLITEMPTIEDQEELRSRQQIIQNVMERMRATELDFDHYTLLCEKNKCFQLAAYLYKKKDNFSKAIQSFLQIQNSNDAFDYLVELTTMEMKTSFFPQINKAILENIAQLLKVNPQETVNVVVEHFHYLHHDIIEVLLQPENEIEYYNYLKLVLKRYEESNDLYQKNIDVDDDFLFNYVRLMCKYDSGEVKSYITKHQINRVEEILKDCINIPNAVSFLLERKGEIAEALEYVFKDMDQVITDLKTKLTEHALIIDSQDKLYRDFKHVARADEKQDGDKIILEEEETDDQHEEMNKRIADDALAALSNLPPLDNNTSIEELADVSSLLEKVSEAIEMCKRNTQRKTIDEKAVKKLWFDLLAKFNAPLRAYRQGYRGIDTTKPDSNSDDSADAETDETDEERKLKQEMENNEKRRKLYMDQLISLKQEFDQETDPEKKQELDEDVKKKAKLAQLAQKKVQLAQQKLEQIQHQKNQVTVDPNAPHNMHKLANLWFQKILYSIVKHVIDQMIGYISIPDILQQVIADNRKDDFSYIRHTVFQLLDKDNYDQELLGMANNILEADSFSLCLEYKHKLQKAVYPSHSKCIVCGYSLVRRWSDDKIVRVNEDGSAYHLSCFYGNRKKRSVTDLSTSKFDQQREKVALFESTLDAHAPNGKMPLYRNLQVDSGLVSIKNQKKNTELQMKLPYIFEMSLVDQPTRLGLESIAFERKAELLKLADSKQRRNRSESKKNPTAKKLKTGRREDFIPSYEASIWDMDGVRTLEDLMDPLLY